MIRQDYFIRLVKEFAAALQRAMAKKDYEKRREAIKDLYTQFIGDYQFYHTATIDEVMKELESTPENERLVKLEMLAELYFAEADYLSNPFKEVILIKLTAYIYSLINIVTTTLSTESISSTP